MLLIATHVHLCKTFSLTHTPTHIRFSPHYTHYEAQFTVDNPSAHGYTGFTRSKCCQPSSSICLAAAAATVPFSSRTHLPAAQQ